MRNRGASALLQSAIIVIEGFAHHMKALLTYNARGVRAYPVLVKGFDPARSLSDHAPCHGACSFNFAVMHNVIILALLEPQSLYFEAPQVVVRSQRFSFSPVHRRTLQYLRGCSFLEPMSELLHSVCVEKGYEKSYPIRRNMLRSFPNTENRQCPLRWLY